ncbi:glycosyltransferase family 4 protein [Eubacterium sp. 1001713B170207_170306_E7]|uniref:glycosyltransferase family 4 protein n=1 Tax=Eubacterium sp. 1001713B170207_170306_E7 TaxID=2787097 RepID=UPI0018997CE5|nr:glycosyltransferase family 4 protein [Eubacterium sp. 1001713B170207_170306_E7]
MRRVCLVAPVPPPYGGIANWTRLLAEYIDEKQHDIQLAVLNTAVGSRETEGRSLWDRVVVSGLKMLGLNQRLGREIRKGRPDIVHITTSGRLGIIRDLLLLKTARRNGIPTSYHIRYGRIPQMEREQSGEWKSQLKACRLADRVIVIDSRTYDCLSRYLPKEKLAYIPNPINLEKLPAPRKRTEKKIAFLGWLTPEKGIQELLSAWQNVSAENPDWSLELIGPYHKAFMADLRKRFGFERVAVTGELSHEAAMDRVNRAGIFVLPSHTEGFPNAVLEAMALGKPIVASRVGAVPDMLEGCGVLVESQNAQMLSQALSRLINAPEEREALGLRAFDRVSGYYNLEKIIEQYNEIWRKNETL